LRRGYRAGGVGCDITSALRIRGKIGFVIAFNKYNAEAVPKPCALAHRQLVLKQATLFSSLTRLKGFYCQARKTAAILQSRNT
jgi:hypothetical protein